MVLLRSCGSHWPLVCYAAVRSIPTQLPCTQHLIHTVAPNARGRREGERQGERTDGRVVTKKDEMFSRGAAVKTKCCILFVRDRGRITRCNKDNPTVQKVICSFSLLTTPAEFRHSFNRGSYKEIN